MRLLSAAEAAGRGGGSREAAQAGPAGGVSGRERHSVEGNPQQSGQPREVKRHASAWLVQACEIPLREESACSLAKEKKLRLHAMMFSLCVRQSALFLEIGIERRLLYPLGFELALPLRLLELLLVCSKGRLGQLQPALWSAELLLDEALLQERLRCVGGGADAQPERLQRAESSHVKFLIVHARVPCGHSLARFCVRQASALVVHSSPGWLQAIF